MNFFKYYYFLSVIGNIYINMFMFFELEFLFLIGIYCNKIEITDMKFIYKDV